LGYAEKTASVAGGIVTVAIMAITAIITSFREKE
jgi:hypothetical protein